MKGVARLTLSLVLLLTQVATTFAGPAFTLCISPKGHECIEAPWMTCTCCQDNDGPSQDSQTSPVDGDDKKICQTEARCSCQNDDGNPLPPVLATAPAASAFPTWQGQPCRCKHVPLVNAQDSQQPVVKRITVDDRQVLDHLLFATATSQLFCFSPLRHAVVLLPIPPPSGHLLAISCTVLRC